MYISSLSHVTSPTAINFPNSQLNKLSRKPPFPSANFCLHYSFSKRPASLNWVGCSLYRPVRFSVKKFGSKQCLKYSRMTNQCFESGNENEQLDEFVEVGNRVADAAGQVIRQYFRKNVDILDKEDLSPVTIADRAAEEVMRAIISEHFPTHAIFGEENGWTSKEENAEYIWVLDPIDGTKSFITGKPLFGTLIALVHKDVPIVGIIDQPILRERWIGKIGKRSTFNGQEISTRSCNSLAKAYMYTTSPHLFSGAAEEAFVRVRNKVKVPLYGCDCYAYALLGSGHVDLVIEAGLKNRDLTRLFLSAFYYVDESHLVYNMLSLLWKGVQLERMMGSVEFASMVAVLLCLSHGIVVVLADVLATFFDYPYPLTSDCAVGFSSVLFALKVVLNYNSPNLTNVYGMLVPARYAAWAELKLIQMFVPGVSFLGHLSGILAGFLYLRLRGFSLAAILCPNYLGN